MNVVDRGDQFHFLPDSDSLASGEELCAITRFDDGIGLPSSVEVTGLVDGELYTEKIPVTKVTEQADYLPRTWAKLQIDCLVADGADKNKAKIIELSKAMYVMSPFTSLLVLETEEMYKQFNVDRGRKDHWAMYPCPDEIRVVYEPDPSRGWWRAVQMALWFLVLVVAAGARSPFGRRRTTTVHDETLIDLTDAPPLASGVVGEDHERLFW